jgi:hypothetical protein
MGRPVPQSNVRHPCRYSCDLILVIIFFLLLSCIKCKIYELNVENKKEQIKR